MAKKYSLKFWIIFWTVSGLFLFGWYFFLQSRSQKIQTISSAINYLPIDSEVKQEFKTIFYFVDYLTKKDDKEKTFLILFQNDMELRPGGGFIGTFGILKIKNGEIKELQTHDLSNFDGRIPSTIKPPYPMGETLWIDSWKLRDSNWSPDFPENAKKAEFFYEMGDGQEKFDGIVAINTSVLNSFLKITGPVSIPGYPGVYDSENAILNLEYQVEKGYVDQGIEKGERKTIMNDFSRIVIEKVSNLNSSQKLDLAKVILEDLNNKDIQLYFKDSNLESQAKKSGWTGEVKADWKKDYLMIVDANLGSFKSDYYIERSFDYRIDLSGEVPQANLKINYLHNGKTKDWMTKDYLTYLRVYTSKDAWLIDSKGLGEVRFGTNFEKKSFETLVNVLLNSSKNVEFIYTSKEIDFNNYDLLIQKQSGVSELSGRVTVIDKDGVEKSYDVKNKNEWKLSEMEN